jgi:hypothetical protein
MSDYFSNLLETQSLTAYEVKALQDWREKIEYQLSGLSGNPRFYYAGSYGKRTIIRQRYDLDIVVYWPQDCGYNIVDIYNAVGTVLERHGHHPNSKTVCWELPFQGGFHIDVVPGRALDAKYYEANLHRTDTGTTLKTSLKKHIDTVRRSGRTDAIRLMKLWKERRGVPFKKSFLLEMMVIEGCKGASTTDMAGQLSAALRHIRDTIETCNIKDPANSNNLLSDDLDRNSRAQIKFAADTALKAKLWSDVLG